MHWSTATEDMTSRHSLSFPNLWAAIKYCEIRGWGYDILYPHHSRWHVRKNYPDNFKWKGAPKEEPDYIE